MIVRELNKDMEKELAKYFAGEASEIEKREIQEWRNQSDENAAEFLAHKEAWLIGSKHQAAPESLLNEILKEKPVGRVIPMATYLRYAAAMLLVCASVFLIYRFTQEDSDRVLIAQEGAYALPDGSAVFLRKGASLELAFTEHSRKVILTGKAHFTVKRDEQLPFIVATENVEVQVLGTSFVVDSETDRVFVESGKVRFSATESSERIELSKGQMARLTSENTVISGPIVDVNYLAWMNKKISFRSLPLTEVAGVLKDVYDLEVKFDSPGIQNCLLSADFNNKNAEEVAGFIAKAFGYDYILSDNKLTLSGKSCE